MACYMIFKFDVVDPEAYGEYMRQVGPILGRIGAQPLVVTPDAQLLEGTQSGFNVVVRFPSEEQALAFHSSPEYAPLKALRLGAIANDSCVLAKEFVAPGS